MKIGYLIPEWPGQSHLWAWREISHLRDAGLEIKLLSTRRPKQLGKHSFALRAEAETSYQWPLKIQQILKGLIWAVCHSPKGFLDCIFLGLTLPVEQRPAWKSVFPLLIPAFHLARTVQQEKIQHLHTPIPGSSAILCMMVKRLTHVPFSFTVVAPFEDWGGAMREKFKDALFFTFVAQWMLDQMRDQYPSLYPSYYCLTRYGVDIYKWQPNPKRFLDSTQPLKIFAIGRLARTKGYDVLLQALAIVKDQGIAFQARIAGEGEQRSLLEKLIRDLDLVDKVTLIGSIGEEQYLDELQVADLFLSPSRSEGFSVARQEAMAVGVATIGSDIKGADELIADGVNGLLVPPEQVEPLAEAITHLLTNHHLRSRLAQAGRQTILEKFDSRLEAQILEDLILASHGKRSSLERSPRSLLGVYES